MPSREFSAAVDGSLKQLVAVPGDDRRWAEFHDLVKDYVLSQVRHSVRDSDVEDVAQDVFTRVLRQVNQGHARDVSNSVGWLKRICLCAAIDYRRRQETQRRQFDPQRAIDESSLLLNQQPTSTTPEQLAIVAENVGHAVASLKPQDAKLYQALATGPQSLDDLAGELGISRAVLAVRITRLKEKIVSSFGS